MDEPDPFDTADLRRRVLATWAANPDRFREDANAEEDLAHGAYRDRLVVELAQNAADAAGRAGVRGRLLLRLVEGGVVGTAADGGAAGVLVAASSGAPLDAVGVRALASLRASSKRDGGHEPAGADEPADADEPTGRADLGFQADVGRFGVGFAAVLSVSDSPAIVSRPGGVSFSRATTADRVSEVAAASPGLNEELARRDGHVPVLRLPFPAGGSPPPGYDTAVLLPLRDDAAASLARSLVDAVDDALLLALHGLAEVLVEVPGEPPRRVADVTQRWHVLRRHGHLDAHLLADRPTEERRRTGWSLTWALPREPVAGGDGLLGSHPAGPGAALPAGVPAVVHAPTPTDDPLPWPALLVATLPLGADRRRVAPGPATDALLGQAATAYGDLLAEQARPDDGGARTGGARTGGSAAGDVLALVPTGLGAGEVDAALRQRVLARLPRVPLLQAVEDDGPLCPRDAVTLRGAAGDDPAALAVLAPVLAGLVAAPPAHRAALRTLGVAEVDLADVIEMLPTGGDAARWRQRYAGLAALADTADRDALAMLPVPLADGRVVRGVRGSVLPGSGLQGVPAPALAALTGLGLRLVHPDAVHPLLERLGALPAGPREVLAHPACEALVERAADAADAGTGVDPADVDAVLHLVSAAGDAVTTGDLPWLGDLPLPDSDGELAPASALVAPGSLAERVLDPAEVGVLDAATAARWPARALAVVGVVSAPWLVRAGDVDLDDLPEKLQEVPGAAAWARDHAPGTAVELTCVAGLDLVRGDAWPPVLAALAADPATQAALVTPVRLLPPVGMREPVRDVPGPSARWLRQRLGLAGCADPDADPDVSGMLAPAPPWVASLSVAVRGALGTVRGWADLDADGWSAVLAAMAEEGRDVSVAGLLAAWRALAAWGSGAVGSGPAFPGADGGELALPDRLRCLTPAGEVVVVPAERVVVPPAPMWAQRDDLGGMVVVPPEGAEALADVLDLDLSDEAAPGRVDAVGERVDVPVAVSALLGGAPVTWRRHHRLRVDGVDVGWWVDGEGEAAVVHAGSAAGLAAGLAQAAGRWDLRGVLAAVLADPTAAGRYLLAEAFTPR